MLPFCIKAHGDMMSKFKGLDELLLEQIGQGINTFARLQNRRVKELALPHARVSAHDVEWDRVIDRRLQALRKAGKITFKNGWHLAKKA